MIAMHGADQKLTNFGDFEHIMIHLSRERGWEFSFAAESVPVQAVFNSAMYAPALLAAAEAEMVVRQIPCDLGLLIEGESNSVFGARVAFDEAKNGLLSQFWRIAASAMIVESLPRNGTVIELDPLQFVFGDKYAHYVVDAPSGKDAD